MIMIFYLELDYIGQFINKINKFDKFYYKIMQIQMQQIFQKEHLYILPLN